MELRERYRIQTERTHYMTPSPGIAVRAVLKGRPDSGILQDTVIQAMKRNAILCCRVQEDKAGSVYYEYMGEPAVRVNRIPHANGEMWESILKEQERLFFDLPKGELLRIFVLEYLNKTELLIISHHLAGDGESLLYFLRDILQILDQGSEAKSGRNRGKSGTSPEEHIPVKPIQIFERRLLPRHTQLKPALRLMTAFINRSWRKKGHTFTWEEYKSFFEEYWKEHKTAFLTRVIEGSDLQNLQKFAKIHNITLNSLLSAAVLAEDNGGLGIPVSVRPADFLGMGNYASGITVEYQYHTELGFLENAEKVNQLIYENLNDSRHKYFLLRFLLGMEGSLIDAAFFSAYGGYEQETARQAAEMFGFCGEPDREGLTNLKNADWIGQYSKFPLCELQFIPPLAPNTKYMIGVITYSGRMCLTFHYPAGVSNEDQLKKFDNIIKRLLTPESIPADL